MTQLAFHKMHGIGNDFVVIDGVNQPVTLTPKQIQQIADRHLGVGCDQLLLVQPATHPAADFDYRIFNADGGEVEQCGNGARCLARFVRETGMSDKNPLCVYSKAGLLELSIVQDGQVSVNMGVPKVGGALENLVIDGDEYSFWFVDMGNPHAVITITNTDDATVATLGPLFNQLPRFPDGVNLGFMQQLDDNHIQLRVYERGVGETLACGSGACAAAVAGILTGSLNNTVQVDLPGGQLQINWAGPGEPVILTGPAEFVFTGELSLN